MYKRQTQRFLEALQNGYHIRMRDLLQAISSNLEKKVLVLEPTVNQTDVMSTSAFLQQLPEHSKVCLLYTSCFPRWRLAG